MPPTATLEDIKAHQKRVEKDKIIPDNLPPCSRCSVESEFFKIHAYRERRFLIIIEMLIKAAYCSLVRFKCPGCGKTFTHYPEFAIPAQTLYAADHHRIFRWLRRIGRHDIHSRLLWSITAFLDIRKAIRQMPPHWPQQRYTDGLQPWAVLPKPAEQP